MICGTVSAAAAAASASAVTLSYRLLMQTAAAVFTLHASGFAFGYLFARFARADELSSRTIS
jgi:predicted Na+-dependent transporter